MKIMRDIIILLYKFAIIYLFNEYVYKEKWNFNDTIFYAAVIKIIIQKKLYYNNISMMKFY